MKVYRPTVLTKRYKNSFVLASCSTDATEASLLIILGGGFPHQSNLIHLLSVQMISKNLPAGATAAQSSRLTLGPQTLPLFSSLLCVFMLYIFFTFHPFCTESVCEQRRGSKVVHIHCGTQSCCTYRGRRALDKKQKKNRSSLLSLCLCLIT